MRWERPEHRVGPAIFRFTISQTGATRGDCRPGEKMRAARRCAMKNNGERVINVVIAGLGGRA